MLDKRKIRPILNNINMFLMYFIFICSLAKITFWLYFMAFSTSNRVIDLNSDSIASSGSIISFVYIISFIARVIFVIKLKRDENFNNLDLNHKLIRWTSILFPIASFVELIKKSLQTSKQPDQSVVGLIYRFKFLFFFKEIIYWLVLASTIAIIIYAVINFKDFENDPNKHTIQTLNDNGIYLIFFFAISPILCLTLFLLILRCASVYHKLKIKSAQNWEIPGFMWFLPLYLAPIIYVFKLKQNFHLNKQNNPPRLINSSVFNSSLAQMISFFITASLVVVCVSAILISIKQTGNIPGWVNIIFILMFISCSIYFYIIINHISQIYMFFNSWKQWLIHLTNLIIPFISIININRYINKKALLI